MSNREGSAVQLDERLGTDQQHPGHGPEVDYGTTWSDPRTSRTPRAGDVEQ